MSPTVACGFTWTFYVYFISVNLTFKESAEALVFTQTAFIFKVIFPKFKIKFFTTASGLAQTRIFLGPYCLNCEFRISIIHNIINYNAFHFICFINYNINIIIFIYRNMIYNIFIYRNNVYNFLLFINNAWAWFCSTGSLLIS